MIFAELSVNHQDYAQSTFGQGPPGQVLAIATHFAIAASAKRDCP